MPFKERRKKEVNEYTEPSQNENVPALPYI